MEALLIKNNSWEYVRGEKVKLEIVAENAESIASGAAWEAADRTSYQ